MKVRQLIARLQKMPQNLEIFYAHHDNMPWETAGECFGVVLLEKSDYTDEYERLLPEDRERFENGVPERCVVIRG